MDKERFSKIKQFVEANLLLEGIIDETYAIRLAEDLFINL